MFDFSLPRAISAAVQVIMISDPPSARTGRQAELGEAEGGGALWAEGGHLSGERQWRVAIRTVFNEVEIGSMTVKLIKSRLEDDSRSSNKPRGFIVVLGEFLKGQ